MIADNRDNVFFGLRWSACLSIVRLLDLIWHFAVTFEAVWPGSERSSEDSCWFFFFLGLFVDKFVEFPEPYKTFLTTEVRRLELHLNTGWTLHRRRFCAVRSRAGMSIRCLDFLLLRLRVRFVFGLNH